MIRIQYPITALAAVQDQPHQLLFVSEVSLGVQAPVRQHQRLRTGPVSYHRAPLQCPTPLLGVGPEVFVQIGFLAFGGDNIFLLIQPNTDMPEAGSPHHQSGRQGHQLVGFPVESGDRGRGVYIDRRQNSGLVEGRQHGGGVEDYLASARRLLDSFLECAHLLPPTSRSLTAWIASTGGNQRATPHLSPPITGVSGPIIPRIYR